MKKLTLTIGIPAYNEEKNIAALLRNILDQEIPNNIIAKNIIVISDGSTDNTIINAKQVKNKIVKIIDVNKRQGIAESQNKLIKMCNTDILVILNADIMPEGKEF